MNAPARLISSRHRSRFKFVALVVTLVTIAALIVWAERRETPAEKEIRRILAELRTAGEPVSAEDLARLFPNPSAKDDAGVLFSNAFLFARKNPSPGWTPIIMSGDPPPARTEPLGEPVARQLRAYCEETKKMFDQIPAPWPDTIRFAPHWERGMSSNMMSGSSVSFVNIRILIQSICTHALDAAESGDAQRTSEMLERSFRVGQMLPSDSLVSHMIKQACAGLACSMADYCFSRVVFTEEQLRELAAAIPPVGTNNFANALRGEHCLAIWAFQQVKAGRRLEDITGLGPQQMPWWKALLRKLTPQFGIYNDRDFLRYLHMYRPSVEMTALPPLEAIAQSTNFMSSYQTNVTSETGQAASLVLAKTLRTHFEYEARLTTVRTGVAVERFRLAHGGQLPKSLDELVPGYLNVVPRDLFDGQPLRFKPLARGYVVYSIGADGVDDGGVEKSGTATKYDVTFTIER